MAGDGAISGAGPEHAVVRASDAERERAAEVVRQAFAEGRLGPGELQQRLDAVLQAGTRTALTGVLADLPAVPEVEPAPMVLNAGHLAKVRKEGRWAVPQRIRAVADKDGRILLDFTHAECRHREILIEAECSGNGPIIIVVPHGWSVHTDAITVHGSGKVSNDATLPADPSAPVIRLTGTADRGRIKICYPPRRGRFRRRR